MHIHIFNVFSKRAGYLWDTTLFFFGFDQGDFLCNHDYRDREMRIIIEEKPYELETMLKERESFRKTKSEQRNFPTTRLK